MMKMMLVISSICTSPMGVTMVTKGEWSQFGIYSNYWYSYKLNILLLGSSLAHCRWVGLQFKEMSQMLHPRW